MEGAEDMETANALPSSRTARNTAASFTGSLRTATRMEDSTKVPASSSRPHSTTTPYHSLAIPSFLNDGNPTNAPADMIKARVPNLAIPTHRRALLLVRSAERVDRLFPDWLTRCFADDGTYEPFDLNFPDRIPKRPHGIGGFANDPPITAMGTATAGLLGRGLHHRRSSPTYILSSPALRSVQTAAAIQVQLGSEAAERPLICVEPGLVEPLGWYHCLPPFLPVTSLRDCGYTVSKTYQPMVSMGELGPMVGVETEAAAARRITATLNRIMDKAPKKGKAPTFLVVGHAFGQDAALRGLAPGTKVPVVSRALLGLAYPYAGLVALREDPTASGGWTPFNPIPPIHYSHFTSVPLPRVASAATTPLPV